MNISRPFDNRRIYLVCYIQQLDYYEYYIIYVLNVFIDCQCDLDLYHELEDQSISIHCLPTVTPHVVGPTDINEIAVTYIVSKVISGGKGVVARAHGLIEGW